MSQNRNPLAQYHNRSAHNRSAIAQYHAPENPEDNSEAVYANPPEIIKMDPFSLPLYTRYYTDLYEAYRANIPDGSSVGGFPQFFYYERKWYVLHVWLKHIIYENHARDTPPANRGKLRFGFEYQDRKLIIYCLWNENIETILNKHELRQPMYDVLLWSFSINIRNGEYTSIQSTSSHYPGSRVHLNHINDILTDLKNRIQRGD